MLRVTMDANDKKYWTTIIQPQSGWFDINIAEIIRYKDLIMLFVKRDFVSVYKQTILGPFWYLLGPIFSTVIYTIIFGNLAKISTEGVPHSVFYLSGIVTWNYFSLCLGRTSETLNANASLFGKVYFPRLTVPISLLVSSLISFSIQFIMFIGIWIFYLATDESIKPNAAILLLPVLLVHMAALGLGIGVIISSLTTKWKDLTYFMGPVMQVWMYGTPIVYPLSEVPANWKWIFIINPMTSIVETFRYAFFGIGGIELWNYLISVMITLVFLVMGLLIFGKAEKNSVDTV